jgi:hypothetical protein
MLLNYVLVLKLLFGQLCLIVCNIKCGGFHVIQSTIKMFLQSTFELEDKFFN